MLKLAALCSLAVLAAAALVGSNRPPDDPEDDQPQRTDIVLEGELFLLAGRRFLVDPYAYDPDGATVH